MKGHTKITHATKEEMRQRIEECLARFKKYERCMEELIKEHNDSIVSRTIYRNSANIWSLARELLLHGLPDDPSISELAGAKKGERA